MNNQQNVAIASLFKIVVMGSAGVGKTLLIRRYVDDTYDSEQKCSIGVDFKIKTVAHKNQVYKLQVWDTAGQERFRCITKSYYRNSSGILLCYEISNVDSFNNLIRVYEDCKKAFEDNGQLLPPIILCGLKCDLDEQREVAPDTALAFAEANGFKFIENSSKMNINVNDTFETLLVEMIDFKKSNDQSNPILNQQLMSAQHNNLSQLGKKYNCC